MFNLHTDALSSIEYIFGSTEVQKSRIQYLTGELVVAERQSLQFSEQPEGGRNTS